MDLFGQLLFGIVAAAGVAVMMHLHERKGAAPPEPAPEAEAKPRPRPAAPRREGVPQELLRRFRTALPDPAVRRRLLERERSRFPGESPAKLVDRILFTLERDRS